MNAVQQQRFIVDHKLQELELSQKAKTPLSCNYFEVDECRSTNDIVQLMVALDFPEGTIVRAHQQIAGRGRRGHNWFSSQKSLQFSLLLRPKTTRSADLPFINVIVSYAWLKVLYSQFQLPALLKWPNDILVADRKLCGVMSEMRTQSDSHPAIVVGCGMNVNLDLDDLPADLLGQATSLKIELKKTFDQRTLLINFLQELEILYKRYLS